MLPIVRTEIFVIDVDRQIRCYRILGRELHAERLLEGHRLIASDDPQSGD